jgi:hypothetical protein
VPHSELDALPPAEIPPEAIVVTMSNDEQAAAQAWKRLAVRPNVNAYVLAGGINRWLDIYQEKMAHAPGPEAAARGRDVLRHRFAGALGSRLDVARPDPKTAANRPFEPKVRVLTPVREEGGGCG